MEDANGTPISPPPPTSAAANNSAELTTLSNNNFSERNPDISDGIKDDPAEAAASEELSSSDTSVYGTPQAPEDDHADEEEEEEDPSPKKQKTLANSPKIEPTEHGMTELPSPSNAIPDPPQNGKPPATKSGKKSKKKSKDVWTTTSRKGKKKTKHASNSHNSKKSTNGGDGDDKVLIIPAPRFPSDDSPDLQISLSKIYKAEKVELSDDRLTAGSTKGYRMVRATRGVTEGAWYYEIKVVHLGDTGHTRLGWSTDKGDLQAPVGYDGNSFGYRDVDGSKVHKALREKYGEEGYKEGDVIGFFINLPDGEAYAPNPPQLVWYKGQRYVCPPDAKEDPPKVVPGSEISFFKNGICQGVAYRDIYGGHYYPAASMYTLPNQQNCVVKFNFGPDFEIFPKEFGGRPLPRPMIEVPYQDYESKVEIGSPRNITRMCPMFKECGSQIGKAAEMIYSA